MRDLVEHPQAEDHTDYTDPDVLSFHEVVCDLARRVAKDPEKDWFLPPEIMDLLFDMNLAVEKIAGIVRAA